MDKDMEMEMNNDYEVDIITLVDDEGTEHEFEILDSIEEDGKVYYALLPNFESPDEALEESTYYIFEAIENEAGEQEMAEVEDNELLDKLAEIFEKRFDEMFEIEA